MVDPGIIAAAASTAIAALFGVIGYFARQVRRNSQVRRYLTGEGIEGDSGEIRSLDERLEESRRQRHEEHERVWDMMQCLRKGQQEIVDALDDSDAIDADVDVPDPPARHRDGRWESNDD